MCESGEAGGAVGAVQAAPAIAPSSSAPQPAAAPLTRVPSKPARGPNVGAQRVVNEVVPARQAHQQLAACSGGAAAGRRAVSARHAAAAPAAGHQPASHPGRSASAGCWPAHAPCGCSARLVMPCCFWEMGGSEASQRRARSRAGAAAAAGAPLWRRSQNLTMPSTPAGREGREGRGSGCVLWSRTAPRSRASWTSGWRRARRSPDQRTHLRWPAGCRGGRP